MEDGKKVCYGTITTSIVVKGGKNPNMLIELGSLSLCRDILRLNNTDLKKLP